MAAVSVPPSPQVLSNMTNRRVPLATVPNAANSPYRPVTTLATKRQRTYTGDQNDAFVHLPPAKKQIIEVDADPRRLYPGRTLPPKPTTALQRKLEAARDPRPVQKTSEQLQRGRVQEDVRQWREHYRKVFPSFVFYFDGIPEDVRGRIGRQIRMLGAREEKFFSKVVTHVVTTRAIPKDRETSNPAESRPHSTIDSRENVSTSRTINPSLLDKNGDFQAAHMKTNFTFEAALQKKSQLAGHSVGNDVDLRRQPVSNADILVKAKNMGIKLWALEKLHRMLTTLFEEDEDDNVSSRNARVAAVPVRGMGREANLSQLLQKEKLTGPADRDMTVATQEMVPLRGCYVYVYDMDEKTKPVMIREYAVPTKKEDGKWPQLRSTGTGKCPFIEDPHHAKKSQHAEQQKAQAKMEQARTLAPRTRAASAQETTAGHDEEIPGEENSFVKRLTRASTAGEGTELSKPLDPPKIIPAKRPNPDAMPPMFNSTQARLRMPPRYAGGEPVASGVQPSNITSAIRSNIVSSISSTAAIPGASRAAPSKGVEQLKRKVFERTSAPSVNSVPSSHLNDMRAALNQERGPPPRAAKRKAQESLAGITEEMTGSEKEAAEKRLAILRRRKTIEKDPKPGYCENCREKFNDFDDHVMSRKHRKFALTLENWKELDDLLADLERPLAPNRSRAA